ncbi:predicted protein [Streptomyces sp. SPB78]|uniref:hypothetical protein n=1 Tax=Streptomyces sp. (strain SPB78) TaxID=591157 RepID=UPI0001B54A24|nr:hypothetical protein [Streptomyces sp. SPB78]EFL04309.1 predicted protein [Streptomyces sp. SPB78]
MSPKERRIPPATSPLAGHKPPTLTPNVGRLKVGEMENQEQAQGEQEGLFEEAPVRRPRRVSRPGRTRGGRRPPPAAADAIPTTVRFDPEESSEIDRFVLELRDDTARRALDKAEVIRELLRLAREDGPTKNKLRRRLG